MARRAIGRGRPPDDYDTDDGVYDLLYVDSKGVAVYGWRVNIGALYDTPNHDHLLKALTLDEIEQTLSTLLVDPDIDPARKIGIRDALHALTESVESCPPIKPLEHGGLDPVLLRTVLQSMGVVPTRGRVNDMDVWERAVDEYTRIWRSAA